MRHSLCFVFFACVGLVACAGTYETVTYEDPKSDGTLVDDTPPGPATYDAALTYDGYENRSAKRFRFDVAAFRDDAEKKAASVLYPSHGAYLWHRAENGAI